MRQIFLWLFLFTIFSGHIISQTKENNVTLILCERYDNTYGPINPGNIFTTGYLTVVAISKTPMYYNTVYIQYDRMNSDGEYVFYKRFPFSFPSGYTTVYFSRVGDNDMEFNHPGLYNIFLLDKNLNVIAYTFAKIVN